MQIIGVEPAEGSMIPGIRKWPEAYMPKIFDRSRTDQVVNVTLAEAEHMTRRMAREEGIFMGISSGSAVHAALELSNQLTNAVIVVIAVIDICQRASFPHDKHEPSRHLLL